MASEGDFISSSFLLVRSLADADRTDTRVKTDKIDASRAGTVTCERFSAGGGDARRPHAGVAPQISRRSHLVRQRTRLKSEIHTVLIAHLIARCPTSDLLARSGVPGSAFSRCHWMNVWAPSSNCVNGIASARSRARWIRQRHRRPVGKPGAFYSHKASVLRVSRQGKTGNRATPFGCAMCELNIDTFCTNSSSAKGWVERVHPTPGSWRRTSCITPGLYSPVLLKTGRRWTYSSFCGQGTENYRIKPNAFAL